MNGSKRVIVCISSVLLCIVVFILLCTIFLISAIRIGFTEKHITDVINKTDLSELYLRETMQIQIVSVPKNMMFSAVEPTTNSSLADMIFNIIDEKTRSEYNITKESIARVLENPKIKGFLAEKTAGYITDLINGKSNASITRNEVIDFLEENPGILHEALGSEPTQEDFDKIISYIPESVTLSNIISMAASQSGRPAQGANHTSDDVNRLISHISVIQAILSVRSMVIMIISVAVIILALVLINNDNKLISLVYSGISFLTAGALYSALWLLSDTIIRKVSAGINVNANLIRLFIAKAKTAVLYFGVLAFVIGLIMIAGYYWTTYRIRPKTTNTGL